MNIGTMPTFAVSAFIAATFFAGCGSGDKTPIAELTSKNPVAELAGNMVLIPIENYAICKYEVTQALWEAVMGNNPSHFKGANLPVENVSPYDCEKFINKLNALPDVKASGYVYRMPTEREWEYAAFGGAHDRLSMKLADGTEIRGFDSLLDLWDNDLTLKAVTEVAWIKANSDGKPHPVGQKKPNAFGLYDVIGNVWEWNDDRASQGGGWNLEKDFEEDEDVGREAFHCDSIGFRLAADPPGVKSKFLKNEERKECVDNLRQIYGACEQAKMSGIAAPKASDIYGPDSYIKRPLVCPTTKAPYSLEKTGDDDWRPVCPNPTVNGTGDDERHELDFRF